jgi:putative colanic acid biosynthesis acetyltransferase WcaF
MGPLVDASRYEDDSPFFRKALRLLWWFVCFLLFRPSPWFLHGWRRLLLRLFGAAIERKAVIHASVRIFAPWNLRMGPYSCMGPFVDCYNVDKIVIGAHATVSQYAHLCSASHDITDRFMRLTTAPIVIGSQAWVCAGAFVGPGVSIGEGGVAAARSCVTKNVAAWTVVGGNPAQVLKARTIRNENQKA